MNTAEAAELGQRLGGVRVSSLLETLEEAQKELEGRGKEDINILQHVRTTAEAQQHSYMQFDLEKNVIGFIGRNEDGRNAASSITNLPELKGVFLTASTFKKGPIDASPFGNLRYDVPITDIKHETLFFAGFQRLDFNEKGKSRAYYLNLILADKIHAEYLLARQFPPLNLNQNPFLMRNENGGFTIPLTWKVVDGTPTTMYTEVFVTGDLHLQEAVKQEPIAHEKKVWLKSGLVLQKNTK
jgi:hypothetical protein